MTAVGWPGVRRATEWGKKKYAGSLAEDLWHRLDAMDVINRGMLFAATLLLCFFPFLIVVSALAGRSVVHTLARSTGLNSEAAADAGHLFASPAATSSAVVGTASMVFFVFGGIAAATALQEIYELAFDLPHRGMKDIPRRLAWLAVLIGASLLGGWAGPGLLHVGGPALLAAVGLAWATGFWWLTMRILLAGRISWRPLFPAACATGVLYVAMEVFFSLFFSAMVISDDTRYGPIGIIFALLSYLIAIGVVVILGAVAGLVWQERSSGKDQDGHLPLPSGESRRSDDRQHQRGATRLKSNRMPRILGVARRSPRAGLCRRFRFRAQNREFGLGLRPGDQALATAPKSPASLNAWHWAMARDGARPTLISSQVFVSQIVAFRVDVPGWRLMLMHPAVVTGVVETPWTGRATRDAARHRGARAGHTLD
jgi:membrane protein